MTVDQSDLSYSSYLALDEVLEAQRPRSGEHDEMLFIVVHQVHELWFKQLLYEFARLQRALSDGHTAPAMQTLHRILAVLRVLVTQIDVIETMTPRQFAMFRGALGRGSGFQSVQFREIEASLGRRAEWVLERATDDVERKRIITAMTRPSIFDSLLGYLAAQGYPVPAQQLHRDVSLPMEPSVELQDVLRRVYRDDGVAAQICERLVDLDQVVQQWRYRHAKMVQRMIGNLPGTGGSAGVAYLQSTLFTSIFPDLAAVRGHAA
ncbi:tryptophan 2,3-dioxygenase [Actinophytocola sediminis]